jgi:poly(beta-D-mannuronate) lyase
MSHHLSRRLVLAGVSSLATLMLSANADTVRLADPFDPRRRRRVAPPAVAAPACPLSLPVVRGVIGVRYYTDEQSTIIDPVLRARNVAANKSLADYVATVQAMSAAWLSSRGTDRAAAACGLKLLGQWAAGGALLGRFNGQGRGSQRWNATGLGIAYLALRHAAPGKSDPAVAAWLGRVGASCRYAGEALKNNHLNWTAAAVAACAVAANNQNLWCWAIAAARRGIAEIAPDGSLPLEIARGSHALGYHNFALTPLLVVAELALVNGIDLYAYNDHALGRLAAFTLRNVADPAAVTRLTGAAQEKQGNLPWLEIWARRNPGDAAAQRFVRRQRPVTFAYAGGNQTLLFGD